MTGIRLTSRPRFRNNGWVNDTSKEASREGFTVANSLFVVCLPPLKPVLYLVPVSSVWLYENVPTWSRRPRMFAPSNSVAVGLTMRVARKLVDTVGSKVAKARVIAFVCGSIRSFLDGNLGVVLQH